MPDESRILPGTIITRENFNEVARAVLAGASFVVAAGAPPIGYTRQFQHQNWIDFVDPVQAGGNNGFNERFHALEHEFDLISAAISSVDDAVTNLQAAQLDIGLVIAPGISGGSSIPLPSGFQQSETKFFAFAQNYTIHLDQVDQTHFVGFTVFADHNGQVLAGAEGSTTGQSLVVTGVAIAKRGGWKDANRL